MRKVWDQRLAHAEFLKKSMQQEIIKTERQIEQLVDRIVGSASPTAISAYEQRIAKLQREKHLAAEKLEIGCCPVAAFDEMLELAFRFLANPWKLWDSGQLEHKKTVLKLTFSSRLPYDRKNGFRTPDISIPFKVLEDFQSEKCGMARLERETSNRLFDVLADWNTILQDIQFTDDHPSP